MEKMGQLLSAALALLVVCLLGAASPAAAEVCSKSGAGTACGTGHGSLYTGTLSAQLAAGKKFSFTSGAVSVNCSESSLEGEVGASGSGSLTWLIFANCPNNLGSTCSVASTASNTNRWPFVIKTGIAPSGAMQLEGFTTEFVCNVLGENRLCRYIAQGGKMELSVVGGETALLVWSHVPVEKEPVSDPWCSNTAIVEATYAITTPDSLYLT